MTPQILVSLAAGALLIAYAVTVRRTWARYHGTRVILCPEAREPAAVRVDFGRAALAAIWGYSNVELASCSQWPARRGCAQNCVKQLRSPNAETDPKALAKRFFAHRACALCGHAIYPLSALTLQPGFMNPVTRTVDTWDGLPAEQLPQAFASWRPLCMSCTLAEQTRQRIPDRVTDREHHG